MRSRAASAAFVAFVAAATASAPFGFAQDPGAVHSRQQIMDSVWDPHFFGPTTTLDAHIAALRR